MPWTNEEKTFSVETYFETKSNVTVQARFRKQFQRRDYPRKAQIYGWVRKFRTHGTLLNLNAKGKRDTHSGRPKSSRTPENVRVVRGSVLHSPGRSVRRRSQELGIPRESVRRILINDLQLYPYRIQIKHKLTAADMRNREVMCDWFCDKIDEDPNFLNNLWFSDEAHFLLSGHVNSKNNVFWGTTPPQDCLRRPLHSIKCSVWVAISTHGIIGPFWFEDENERAVSEHRALLRGPPQVLGCTWPAKGVCKGGSMVSAGKGNSPHLK